MDKILLWMDKMVYWMDGIKGKKSPTGGIWKKDTFTNSALWPR